jgi:hypothetical protein
MSKPKKSTTRKLSWRDYNDASHRSFPNQPSPESLHPGPQTVLSAICGSPEARAIMNIYAFRFPVTIVEVLA